MASNIVRSEDGDPRAANRNEAPAGRLRGRREVVPGYERQRQRFDAGRSTEKVELLQKRAVVDAAAASFHRVPDPENVLGADDRTEVLDTTDAPWARICALRIFSTTGKEYVGTGWLIGPRTVITAGHCVFLHDEGGWPDHIEVIPGLRGAERHFGSATGKRFRSVKEWATTRDTGNDYGTIILDDDLGTPVGSWFTFGALEDAQLAQTEANLAGYPQDKGGDTLWYHARTLTMVDETKVYYDIDTYGGQSGSPVWLNLDGKRVVIAIHTTGTVTGNSGTKIRPDVFQNLKTWKAEGS
jgi:V8-like Glu-specific endopeptidase